jgi:hypothetical protein
VKDGQHRALVQARERGQHGLAHGAHPLVDQIDLGEGTIDAASLDGDRKLLEQRARDVAQPRGR